MSWDRYQSRDPRRIDPMKTPLYDYVVLDTETTGFKPENGAKLIEIGAVKIHGGKLVDRYEQLIDPHQHIPEHITSLTGINDSMVIGQPDVSQAIIRFDKWLGPRTIIMAHNASFDLSFLDAAMKTVNGGMFFFPHRFVDTLEMSRKIHPEKPSHKVAVLIRDYGIGDVEEHRALSDATQENMLYEAMRREEFGCQMGYEDMFNPECRDYLKSRKPSQREQEIAKLEKQADKKHDMYGNKTLYEVSGEVAAIYESQKALRLRLESIEEKLDELLRTQKGLG